MVHRIVTFRVHMNAISDGEEIKYRYLVSEWERQGRWSVDSRNRQVGVEGGRHMGDVSQGKIENWKRISELEGFFLSLLLGVPNKQKILPSNRVVVATGIAKDYRQVD